MDAEFVRNRITQLRMQKGVSEYRMSYDLGHSRGYVHNISSGKALPSMMEFFAICDYFQVSPPEFFNSKNYYPNMTATITQKLERLNEADLKLIMQMLDRLCLDNNQPE